MGDIRWSCIDPFWSITRNRSDNCQLLITIEKISPLFYLQVWCIHFKKTNWMTCLWPQVYVHFFVRENLYLWANIWKKNSNFWRWVQIIFHVLYFPQILLKDGFCSLTAWKQHPNLDLCSGSCSWIMLIGFTHAQAHTHSYPVCIGFLLFFTFVIEIQYSK